MTKIRGTKNADVLVGTEQNDFIRSGLGDDLIVARGGLDVVNSGAGNDKVIIHNDTSATVFTGSGNDSLIIRKGAIGVNADLGLGDDAVTIKDNLGSERTFHIDGNEGSDTVNFVTTGEYQVLRADDGTWVVDVNDNVYNLKNIESITFNDVLYEDPNSAPTLAIPITDKVATELSSFSYTIPDVTFIDTDGDAITYSATLANGDALPSWMVFDPTTMTFSGNPVDGSAGTYEVKLTASDGKDATADTFNVVVSDNYTPPPPPPEPTFAEILLQDWQTANAEYVEISAQTGGVAALFGNYTDSTPYEGGTLGEAALEVNNDFLDLASSYITYLENGGAALTDIIVKSSPTRSQSLHDNLLGNITIGALGDRNLDDAGNLTRFGDWVNRDYVSGNLGDTNLVKGVAFDFEHDVSRTDYHSFDTTQTDANLTAVDLDGTLLNNGVPGEHFNITTFNAAGIEMGLVAHKYGNVYADGYVNGTTYTVEDGISTINPGRSDWSFGMSVQEGLNGSGLTVGDATVKGDYDVGIWIDIDKSSADQFVFLANLEEIPDSVTSNADVFQNSWNFGFGFIKDQLSDSYGVDFAGEGEFSIELRLTDVADGSVDMVNSIDVFAL